MSDVNPIQVQKFLSGVDYPVDKSTLVEHARSQGADDDVVAALDGLPERDYHGPNAVSQELSNT
jgi:hypothetical protein